MKKIFIDLGSNDCKITDAFMSIKNDYEVFCFEPNPVFESNYKNKNLLYSQKIVFTKDGTIPFKIDRTRLGLGSSVVLTKRTGDLLKEENFECIDFSRWIKETFSDDDFIVVKCDIEGAEYDLFPYLEDQKTLEMIDVLLIELHPNFKLGINEGVFLEKERKTRNAINKMREQGKIVSTEDNIESHLKVFKSLP